MNTAIGRTETAYLTNKSGGSVAQGDVVIVDIANASAFTTTTTAAYVNGVIGVIIEPNGIANNGSGLVALAGWVPVINLSATGNIGDLVKTHTVAKQGVRHTAAQVAGDFAMVLGTSATPAAILFGAVQQGGSGSSGTFTDYSATSTVSGWSGTPTKQIWTYKIDRLVVVMFYITGTSSLTTASFTLPNAVAAASNAVFIPCVQVVDNGIGSSSVGRVELTGGSATINVAATPSGGAFTGSGTKTVRGSFSYFSD